MKIERRDGAIKWMFDLWLNQDVLLTSLMSRGEFQVSNTHTNYTKLYCSEQRRQTCRSRSVLPSIVIEVISCRSNCAVLPFTLIRLKIHVCNNITL